MKTIYLFLLIFMGLFVKAQKEALMANDWYISKVVINNVEFPFEPYIYAGQTDPIGETIFTSELFHTTCCNWLISGIAYTSDNQFTLSGASMSLRECYMYYFQDKYWSIYNNKIFYNLPETFSYTIENSGTAKVLTITNEKGDKAIYGSEKLAVKDVSAQKIGLYPNPVKDQLAIKTNDKIETVEIFSTSGQLIKTSGSKVVDTSALPKGNYIVKIKTDKGTVVEKLIKN